jgi:hypothetical protein
MAEAGVGARAGVRAAGKSPHRGGARLAGAGVGAHAERREGMHDWQERAWGRRGGDDRLARARGWGSWFSRTVAS